MEIFTGIGLVCVLLESVNGNDSMCSGRAVTD